MNTDVKSIFYNVIGGVIVAVLSTIYINIRYRIRTYRLQRLVGFHFKPNTEIGMVYGKYLLAVDPSGKETTHPYVKAPRYGEAMPPNVGISIEHPVSECEVRASTYIAKLLGINGNLRPLLISDVDTNTKLDSNFISFGGPDSNYKTADILTSKGNIFDNCFSLLLPFSSTREVGGLILRITPPSFPSRSWIICAGSGEWGTSGSAWFLAYKWKELIKNIYPTAYWSGIMHIPDFLAIIRVVRGQDQSARMVALYRNDNGTAIMCKLKNLEDNYFFL